MPSAWLAALVSTGVDGQGVMPTLYLILRKVSCSCRSLARAYVLLIVSQPFERNRNKSVKTMVIRCDPALIDFLRLTKVFRCRRHLQFLLEQDFYVPIKLWSFNLAHFGPCCSQRPESYSSFAGLFLSAR